MHKILLAAVVIILLQVPMSSSGSAEGAAAYGHPGVDPHEGALLRLTLDTAALHAAALQGTLVDLPSVEGRHEVRLVSDARTIPVYEADGDSLTLLRHHTTNVWRIEGEGVRGVALLRADTLQAHMYVGLPGQERVSVIQPAAELVPGAAAREYAVYRPATVPRPEGAPSSFEPGGFERGNLGPPVRLGEPVPPRTMSHTVTRTIMMYVDSNFVNQYGGMTWPDRVAYVLSVVNTRMTDVNFQLSLWGAAHDTGFNTDDFDSAWNRIVSRDYVGAQSRGHFAYRDWTGWNIGTAWQPGDTMMIQHKGDSWHGGRPGDDFEITYLTKHEFGHNLNGDHGLAVHDCAWSHCHDSIMEESAWDHYHDYISAANQLQMRTNIGTNH